MDDFINRVRNGNLKRYGLDRNRNDRRKRKPKNSNQRKANADYWPMLKKQLEKIGDSHRRIATAQERKAKCEERKADAMERIADCLNRLLKSASDNKLKDVPVIRKN